MIVKIVKAFCDRSRCMESVQLDPTNLQPYKALMRHGWGVDSNTENILTFCPKHKTP